MGKKTDKREMPWMPFYVNDFLSSAEVYLMTPEEGWGYLNLLFAQWQSGAKRCIPSDKEELAKLSRLGGKWGKCSRRIMKQFVRVGGSGFRNKRCAEIYRDQELKYQKLYKRAVKGGKASAKSRATQVQPKLNLSSTNHNHNHNHKKKITKKSVLFNRIWSLYPAKQGRAGAEVAFHAAVKSGVDPQTIEDGVKAYIAHVDHARRTGFPDLKHKHGSTWFRGKCWQDTYDTPTVNPNRGLL